MQKQLLIRKRILKINLQRLWTQINFQYLLDRTFYLKKDDHWGTLIYIIKKFLILADLILTAAKS